MAHHTDAHLRCRDDLILSAVTVALLLVTARLCPGSPSADFGRFVLGGLGLPLVAVWWGRVPLWQRLLRGGMVGGGWVLGYRAFVSYRDHPWLAGPETFACDGPCFGWYTFEFSPPYAELVVVVVIAVGLGLAARGALWLSQREQRISNL